ncbi:MAG: zinc ribbon domain-containing protein [Pseudomonadota bacterium]
MSQSSGIHSWNAYVPRLVMARAVIGNEWSWLDRAAARAKGERRFGNWDEDSLTLAQAAARPLVGNVQPNRLVFASTSAPFLDRSNATLMAESLGLLPRCRATDVSGSQRAASAALIDALALGDTTLLASADRIPQRPGSVAERDHGDAGAALMIGPGDGVARLLAVRSVGFDFVDHYRTHEQRYDYALEDRWVRDEGLLVHGPSVVEAALDASGKSIEDVAHFVTAIPAHHAKKLAGKLGLERQALADDMTANVGHSGCAHVLLILAGVLDRAAPGDVIVVLGVGQGFDAVVFQATDAIADHSQRASVARTLARRTEVSQYLRLPVFNRELSPSLGIRGEADKRTAMSAYYREHRALNAMIGSQCLACGTPHFPPARVCVNCRAEDQMDEYAFSHRTATLKSFTEDWQTATLAPPMVYGHCEFDGGGNAFLELTDVEPGTLAVGQRLTMEFRIKDFDHVRGFRRYFWKPVPEMTRA